MSRTLVCTTTAALALGVALAMGSPALAHEHRKVGSYTFTVGWTAEPVYTGFTNNVELILQDTAGKPVTDLGDSLKVEVLFGSEKLGPLALDPRFDLKEGEGKPGDYGADIIPTRPGNYTFHFTGSIKGQQVDERFASSETTFDPARDPSEAMFPARDPSAAQLASRVQRLGSRLDSKAHDATSRANLGVIVGGVGIVVALGLGITALGRKA